MSMKAGFRTVCLFLIAWPVFSIAAQGAKSQGSSSPTGTGLGVVVSKVAKNSDAEKAGLQEGDLILTWAREASTGPVDSPFVLLWTEIDQSPRGPVTLEGQRAGEKRSWTLKTDRWGISSRPNLPASVLNADQAAEALVKAGKFSEAQDQLQALAKQVPNARHATEKTPWPPLSCYADGRGPTSRGMIGTMPKRSTWSP
jgi:C-terminal processing protease CtpA/Prc